jgi:antitoxin component of RelBE/YafQ-DinJ toxin-antitoxin module
MISQVVFKIDEKLKKKAMKRAEGEGLTFSTVLKLATQAYVDGGLEVGLKVPERFNPKTRKELDKTLKDIDKGKNLSPAFGNVNDMMAYLET